MTTHAVAFAPGRANLIGEHTDYNEGLALPFAISEGVTVRASPLPEPRIEAVAVDLGKRDTFSLTDVERAGGWRGFVRGAAGELLGAGLPVGGAVLEISGTVPRGAGLSSSAALEVALVLALLCVSGVAEPDRLELARMCSRIENDWVGAQTGLLDQISSLFGEANHALRIDFRSLDVRPVALELGGCRLVTLDSGEHHANVSSGYNERRAECARACVELGVASLRDASVADADRLPDVLRRRALHVITENERVEEAVSAVERGDMPSLGRLIDASHASLRDCYEVSTPAVEAAVSRLKRAGALGARIVGGGFGGHVLGLLPDDAVAPDDAVEVRPGDGARVSRS
ncbi:MAG TPA: galactokinase family protein [Solirubrobacteraceae bacterium]|nr:galactokinase family protein [Solirubrobacteraceae bacterium]